MCFLARPRRLDSQALALCSAAATTPGSCCHQRLQHHLSASTNTTADSPLSPGVAGQGHQWACHPGRPVLRAHHLLPRGHLAPVLREALKLKHASQHRWLGRPHVSAGSAAISLQALHPRLHQQQQHTPWYPALTAAWGAAPTRPHAPAPTPAPSQATASASARSGAMAELAAERQQPSEGHTDAAAFWPPASEQLEAVAQRLREQPAVQHAPVSTRAAAVLVGLFEDASGVVRVLLTQRSSRLKSHRGEVCLPGGKRDEGDADDAATALREAHEELGLDPSTVTVLGTLPPVLSKHHLSVTPVLALVPPGFVPQPNPGEVAAAFTVPLSVFLGDSTDPRVCSLRDAAAAAVSPDGSDGQGRRTRRKAAEEQAARQKAAAGVGAAAVPLSWRPEEGTPPREKGGGRGQRAASPPPAARAAPAAPVVQQDGVAGHGAATHGSAAAAAGPVLAEDMAYAATQHTFQDISWGQHKYRIHSFQYGEFDVWGLTATICIAASQLALGRAPSFQERCPGGQHYSAFYFDGTGVCVRPVAAAPPAGSAAAAAAAGEAAPTAGALAPDAAAGAGANLLRQQQQAGEAGPMRSALGGRSGEQAGVQRGQVLPSGEELQQAPDLSVEAIEEEAALAASG